MNTEEFEKQLQRQELRPVPGHWRQQILSEARQVESRGSKVEGKTNKSWIHQFLWPCPQAWGALAAIWVVVIVLNFSGREVEPQVATTSAPSRVLLMALKQQKQQLRAELLGASEMPVAEPPKWRAPQSRILPLTYTAPA